MAQLEQLSPKGSNGGFGCYRHDDGVMVVEIPEGERERERRRKEGE